MLAREVFSMTAAFLFSLVAAASPTPSPSPLPVIATSKVATGSPQTLHRLPLPSSVLDLQQISSIPATTTDALLAVMPGFDRDRSNSMFTNYGQLRVSFDGAGSDRGLVLADGVPAQDGFGGQIDWAEYPAADLVRAEMLRGPGAALYGASAVGGVLALDTLAPPVQGEPGSGFFSIGGGTHAFERFDTGVSAALSQRLSVSVFGEHASLSYDDITPAYASPIDKPAVGDQTTAAVRLLYALSSASSISYEERGAWDAQDEGRPNYSFARRLAQQAVHYLSRGARSFLEIVPYARQAFVTNLADRYPSAPGVLLYTQYVPTSEDGATLHWSINGGSSTFDVLADEKLVRGESEQFGPTSLLESLSSGTQHLEGLGVQETLDGHSWELVAGVHADVEGSIIVPSARTSRALSPRAAFRYDLTKHLAFRGSAGGGLRLPYLNELVRSYRIGAVAYVANPNLLPERSASFSAGFDWVGAAQHASLDFFSTAVGDAIMFRTISPTEQMYENVNRTRSDGATFTYADEISRRLRVTLSATLQNARVAAGVPVVVGKQLQYVPDAETSVVVDGQIGAVQTGVTFTYAGQTYADDLNTEPLGSAAIVGLHGAFPIGDGTSLVLDVQNATAQRYLSSIDRYGPPMTASIGIRQTMELSRPSW